MLTSKQRAYLRKLAHNIEPILQIGKLGASPETAAAIDEAIEARELIKISILSNCPQEPQEAAEILCKSARAQCVQVIGKKIVMYRKNYENPTIKLPN